MGWCGLDRSGSGQEPVNTVIEASGFIKHWEIFEYLSDWRLLKKGSAH
jgi:hypothetical protein